MKVLIKIINLSQTLNIFADDKTNEVIVNSKHINYDANEFIGEISFLTFNWRDSYYSNQILDGEEFRIKLVSDNNKERLIVGKNSFPSNYSDFKNIIKKVAKL